LRFLIINMWLYIPINCMAYPCMCPTGQRVDQLKKVMPRVGFPSRFSRSAGAGHSTYSVSAGAGFDSMLYGLQNTFNVQVSYFEIYNEKVYDLLSGSSSSGKQHATGRRQRKSKVLRQPHCYGDWSGVAAAVACEGASGAWTICGGSVYLRGHLLQ
jgi:hypothetical protein